MLCLEQWHSNANDKKSVCEYMQKKNKEKKNDEMNKNKKEK